MGVGVFDRAGTNSRSGFTVFFDSRVSTGFTTPQWQGYRSVDIAPTPDPRLDRLASLEKQRVDARKIKNPTARANRIRSLNRQINLLKAEIASGGSGSNSELASLQKQLADARMIKDPIQRAKKIAEINAKIAALRASGGG